MSLAEISSYLNDVSMDNLKAGCIIDMGSLLGCGSFCKTYTAWICYVVVVVVVVFLLYVCVLYVVFRAPLKITATY